MTTSVRTMEQIDFHLMSLNLDLEQLGGYLLSIERDLAALKNPRRSPLKALLEWSGSATTANYGAYNLMTLPHGALHELHAALRTLFYAAEPDTNTRWYLQSWLNVHRHGTNLKWHGHWGRGAYHGYFCVNAEPSRTLYRSCFTGEVCTIHNTDNTLLLAEGGSDHCVSSWQRIEPRITIAYDIVAQDRLKDVVQDPVLSINHWFPMN